MEHVEVGTVPPGPEMSAFARLLNVFVAPTRAFESIARRPGKDWLLPAALLVAVALVFCAWILPKVDVDRAADKQLEAMESWTANMPEEAKADMEKSTRDGMEEGYRGSRRFLGVLFPLVPLFVVPLFYHWLAAAFGGKTRYVAVLTGYAYVQMVQVLKSLLLIAVAYPRDTLQLDGLPRLLKSNVAAFLDPESTPRFLLALAASLDVFEIWALFLGCLALWKVTRLSRGVAAGIVIGLWALWVLITSGFAAMGFGG